MPSGARAAGSESGGGGVLAERRETSSAPEKTWKSSGGFVRPSAGGDRLSLSPGLVLIEFISSSSSNSTLNTSNTCTYTYTPSPLRHHVHDSNPRTPPRLRHPPHHQRPLLLFFFFSPQSSPPISLPNSIATIFPNSPPANDAPRPFAENPSDWTNDWRQTPPYRPINRGLNRELRPWGTSVAEQGFILHMFEGVLLQAVGQVLS